MFMLVVEDISITASVLEPRCVTVVAFRPTVAGIGTCPLVEYRVYDTIGNNEEYT